MLASSALVRAQKTIGAFDILLGQQILIRGVTQQHISMLQVFGDRARPIRIVLDDLDVARRLHRHGEALTDIAAAGDDDPAARPIQLAELTHHRARVFGRSDEEDLVAGLDHGVARAE